MTRNNGESTVASTDAASAVAAVVVAGGRASAVEHQQRMGWRTRNATMEKNIAKKDAMESSIWLYVWEVPEEPPPATHAEEEAKEAGDRGQQQRETQKDCSWCMVKRRT
jgi:hypothetical protein